MGRNAYTLNYLMMMNDAKRLREGTEFTEEFKKKRREEINYNSCSKKIELEEKERIFQFAQIKLRANIRLRQGRPKPIDKLFMQIHCHPDHNPYLLIKGLEIQEIKELYDEIKLVMELETVNRIILYWDSLLVICEWKLGFEGLRKEALHSTIEDDVNNLLRSKTYVELEKLETEIKSQMRSGAAKVVEYWESVLKHLRFYKAKAFLNEIQRADERRDNIEAIKEEAGSHSPELLHCNEYEDGIEHIEDKAIMEQKRICVLKELKEQETVGDVVKYYNKKFQLRKPRYSVHVRTGYNWNRYNRVHYDYDHPPPKAVQGYKFMILYPDLVEKGKAPVFAIEKDKSGGSSDDTCILRFHAGPPYEDIAFKIVNEEWEYLRKRGFKCTFDGRILLLDFNFKRCTYHR